MTPYFKNLLLAVPFTVLSIIPFILLEGALGVSMKLHLIALGAFGWWLALILRVPVILAAKGLASNKGRRLVILSSGPAEETVRLVLLLTIGLTVENGYLIGLGWAGVEIIYSIVQGLGIGVLQQKTDKKAEEAKAMLRTIGMDKTMDPTAPFWGIVERLSANAMHISFSLLLAASPYLILLTAPLHSFMNVLITRLVKRSLAIAEMSVLVLSATVFLVTLLLTLD